MPQKQSADPYFPDHEDKHQFSKITRSVREPMLSDFKRIDGEAMALLYFWIFQIRQQRYPFPPPLP